MNSKIFLIALIGSGCASCAGNFPKPEPIPRCALVANRGGSPAYLRCQNFDGEVASGPVVRIPINDLQAGRYQEKFICTTDAGYAYMEGNYAPQVRRWISQNCR